MFVLSYYVYLRSVFRAVMSVTIAVLTQCSVGLYNQLFVGWPMSWNQVGNWQPVDSRCYYRHCYEREDIKLSAHDAFLDYPSSGTLKIEDWKAK
jgi:hypothetical protein